jgi:integrase/recombinase XerD
LAVIKKNEIRPPAKQRLRRAVSHEECVALLNEVYTLSYRGVLGLMYGCGLRVSEAVTLQTKDIDAKTLTLRIIGKGNKERLVPLPQGLLADLRKIWAQHRTMPWIFPNRARTNHIDSSNIDRLVRSVRKSLGLDESITPHSLRHGYATRLLEQGLPIETIRILMGHESIKTTQVYLHLSEAVRAQVQEAAASFYIPLSD